jgi:hypothetical protein
MMVRGHRPSEISAYINRTGKNGEVMPYPVSYHQRKNPKARFKIYSYSVREQISPEP